MFMFNYSSIWNIFIRLINNSSALEISHIFTALITGVVKYTDVKDAGSFLIEIMPVMFIPAGVGLVNSWVNLKPILIPVSIITVVTIITVMLSTGWISQIIIRRTKK